MQILCTACACVLFMCMRRPKFRVRCRVPVCFTQRPTFNSARSSLAHADDDRTKGERHARASREDVCPHPAVVQQNHIRGLFLPPFRCHCTSQGNHEWPSYSATHEALLGLPLSPALQMQKEGRRGISFSPSSPRPAHAPSHSFTPPFPLSPTTHRVGSCPTRV